MTEIVTLIHDNGDTHRIDGPIRQFTQTIGGWAVKLPTRLMCDWRPSDIVVTYDGNTVSGRVFDVSTDEKRGSTKIIFG